jgi:hypothetical protein
MRAFPSLACRVSPALIAAALLFVPLAARASPDVYIGGVAQPEAQWQQQDPSVTITNPRNSGFALHHARLIAAGSIKGWNVKWEARVEMEMVPAFQLLDAYLAATKELIRDGYVRVIFGQQFAPFSRQTMLPLHTLQMVDYAQLTTLAPGRQLGVTVNLALPVIPWVQVSAGLFNGKGINIVENLDQNLEYVGRLAFKPIGARVPDQESALGPNQVSVAGDVSYSKQAFGDYNQSSLLVGADAFFCMFGLSAYAEYLWGNITYTAGAPKQNYHEQGFNAQAGYLLPIPGRLWRRFEVTARYEAVAPNQTVPITGPGDPTQARDAFVAGINYYHRGHNLKLMLNYTHNMQLDAVDATGRPATYKNDSLVLQLSYRLE